MVFQDLNNNRVRDENEGENGIEGVEVWLDINNNDVRESNEIQTTNASGHYQFSGLISSLRLDLDLAEPGDRSRQTFPVLNDFEFNEADDYTAGNGAYAVEVGRFGRPRNVRLRSC